MRRRPQLVSESPLLRAVRALGRPVTPVQLASWRKRGLIPSPKRRGLGRGAGSRTLGYRWSTLPQLLALASLLRERRDLEHATWELWLAGYPVTPAVHRLLLRRAERLEEVLGREIEAENAALDSDNARAGSRLLARLTRGRVPSDIARARRRFRGNRREQFETVVRLVLESARGEVPERIARGDLHEDELDPLRRALAGLIGLSQGQLASNKEVLDAFVRALLAWLATEANARTLLRELRAVDGDLLEDVRDELAVGWAIRALQTDRAPFAITPTLFLVWFALRWVSVTTSAPSCPHFKRMEWDGVRSRLADLFHTAKRASILAPLFSEEALSDGDPLLETEPRGD